MRGRNIDFKGINRQIGSPDNDDGFCSELINLKVQNGLKIAGNKVVKSAEIPYTDIRIHKIGKVSNYIGIKRDAEGCSIEHFDPETGKELWRIHVFDANHEVYYTLLNNMIVVSDKTAIKEYVYQFTGYVYIPYYDGLQLPISSSYTKVFFDDNQTEDVWATSDEEYVTALQAHVNKFKIENKEYSEGAFMYAFTITLNDGTETGMYNLTSVTTDWNTDPSKEGAFINYSENFSGTSSTITTKFLFKDFYQKTNIKIDALELDEPDMLKLKRQISKVNLYASVPITRMPIQKDKVTTNLIWEEGKAWASSHHGVTFDAVMTEDSKVESTLLYRQKSWTLEEFVKGFEYTLEFGGDKQTTGATMEVSQSSIERAGKMFAYNRKVHFYDSNVRLLPALGQMKEPSKTASYTADVYVKIKTDIKDCVMKYPSVEVNGEIKEGDTKPTLHLPDVVTYSDSRAYEMIIYIPQETAILKFELSPSPAYNYAYAFRSDRVGNKMTSKDVEDELPEQDDTYSETNAINVTAGGQPIVFPVAYSYKFDGNITALAVAMQQISDAQVGQWPLGVYTDNGIYALEQGNGAVLYSNIVPLTGDTCINENICYTSQGTAYISNGAVYLLNGRNATKLSLLLEGKPDTYIQNNDSFLKCCGGSLYNIAPYLSVVDFREYVNDAKLSWCANTNELIVSNSAYPYSYVYNFVYNSWYKVTGVYEGIEDNLILKPISLNNGNEAPASAKVTLSALHVEQTKQISVLSKVSYPTSPSCGAGHNIALIIDGTQVASAVFSQITYTPMMVSVLCESIGYLEDEPGTIYSKTDLASKTVRLYNISTGADIFSATFSATSESVIIADKAIGTKVTLTVDNTAYNEVFLASSSAVTLLNNLADKVNANDTKVYATVQGNTIVLTAKTAGSQGNNINVAVTASNPNYLYISTTAMTGGEDISLQPSAYKEIIDWSMDEDAPTQTVHLHTRPMCIDDPNGYKTIRRGVLNCLAALRGEQNLSLYIYATNNLMDYKCVAASQRKDCEISQITLDRIAKSYKYFVFMLGGKVDNNTQIGLLALAVEDTANKKLR